MRLIRVHLKASVIELVRIPMFSVPTLILHVFAAWGYRRDEGQRYR